MNWPNWKAKCARRSPLKWWLDERPELDVKVVRKPSRRRFKRVAQRVRNQEKHFKQLRHWLDCREAAAYPGNVYLSRRGIV